MDSFTGSRVVTWAAARDKDTIFTGTTHAKKSISGITTWFGILFSWYKLNLHTLASAPCVYAAWLSSLMDPCSLSDICDSCHQLATCKALNGSNDACYCNHGYTGDGTTFCNGEYKHTKLPVPYWAFTMIPGYSQPCVCHGSLDYFMKPLLFCFFWLLVRSRQKH